MSLRPTILIPLLAALTLGACKSSPSEAPPPGSATPEAKRHKPGLAPPDSLRGYTGIVMGTPTAVRPDAGPAAAAAVLPAAITGKPLLWKLTRGADHIYLFGTIHTGGESFVVPAVWAALATAKVFVMEADITSIDQAQMLKMVVLPPGQSLDTMLSPAAWKIAVANAPIPEAQLKKMKPWFAAVSIMQGWMTGAAAVDLALLARAKQAGDKIDYLETWQEQLAMIGKALDAKAVEAFLADLPKGKASLDELVAAYQAGDIDKIITITNDDPTMTAEAREIMLTRRNQAWTPKLEALAKAGDAFVAVGAGHIVGKDGLIELLKKDGFKAERVE